MKNSSYKRIIYFIGIVILITLGIQVYWNYQNYQAGKQQLINEVQISLDNAVEQYYASGAQKMTMVTMQNLEENVNGIQFGSVNTQVALRKDGSYVIAKNDTQIPGNNRFTFAEAREKFNPEAINQIDVFGSKRIQNLDSLVTKIVVSMKQDTLNMSRMDSLVQKELQRKKIGVSYGLLYNRGGQQMQRLYPENLKSEALQTRSKSAWLPQNSELSLYFSNETATILRANMIGLLLSGLLMAAVIGCLLFLLRIIKDQKQLAEIKNDLISNITHEFKTPISTIRVAMEGIINFNAGNDPEKAKNYARTSTEQVEKLDNMVEKLLETATLTGNSFRLEKQEVYLAPVLKSLLQKYRGLAPHKSFHFEADREDIKILGDPFHLENAFSNILDNAVKYGGDEIRVKVNFEAGKVIVLISDNGNTLTKAEASQIYEKFYRVPKGNTHDVKGFGIGLYYTKQIVERHDGNIRVEVNKDTTFIVELPYE